MEACLGGSWASLHIFLLVSTLCASAEIQLPEGCWNGKPWEEERLAEGLKAKDAAAVAEWVTRGSMYWGVDATLDELIEKAQIAADAKLPLGDALMSWCLLTRDESAKVDLEARKFAEKSRHPLGVYTLAQLNLQGRGGFERSVPEYGRLLKLSVEQDCVLAIDEYIKDFARGRYGQAEDDPKALQLSNQYLKSHHSYYSALIVIGEEALNGKKAKPNIELLNLSVERLYLASQGKLPHAMSVLGFFYCKTGRPNEGVPLILEGAQTPSLYSSERAFYLTLGRSDSRKNGTMGQYSTGYQLAREASAAASGSTTVLREAADSYLFKWGAEKINPVKAEPLVHKYYNRGGAVGNGMMGQLYFTEVKSEIYDSRRGIAHLVYGSRAAINASHSLSYLLIQGKVLEDRDLAKGWASAKTTHGRTSDDIQQSKMLRLMKMAEKKMTPEQLEEAKELAAQDYPIAPEFRRAAFEVLKEYGDIAEDAVFK